MADGVSITKLPQIWEKTTAIIQGTLVNEFGVAIDGALVQTLTLTLFRRSDASIINSRNAQNINGVNGGSVSSTGAFEMRLDPADNVLATQTVTKEQHGLVFVWTWLESAVTRTGAAEMTLPVVNLSTVT